MKKIEFLNELRKELKNNKIAEIEDIIEDYEEHFNYKIEEGKTEEEITRKLSSPKEIAKEYNINSQKTYKGQKVIVGIGIGFITIFAFCFYILLLSTVVVMGALTIASLATGVCLVTSLNIANLIPSMPYLCAFAFGLCMFGLAMLSAIGTIYLFLYIKQWTKVYFRFCKNLLNNNIYPTISAHPKISKKVASTYKLITIIGLITCVLGFGLGYLIMYLYTGSFEGWHVWNWFV